MLINIIGWIGNILFLIGTLFIIRKNVKGFYYNFVGNLCYIVMAILMRMTSVLALSLMYVGLNIIGIKKWKEKE